jgi:hypothetical protein
MQPLKIEAADTELPTGEIGVVRHVGRLSLPAVLAEAMEKQGVRTSSDFVAYAQAFPSFMAQLLNWSPKDVLLATERLQRQIGDLSPQAAPGGYAFGAMDPSRLPPRR